MIKLNRDFFDGGKESGVCEPFLAENCGRCWQAVPEKFRFGFSECIFKINIDPNSAKSR